MVEDHQLINLWIAKLFVEQIMLHPECEIKGREIVLDNTAYGFFIQNNTAFTNLEIHSLASF